MVAILTSAVVGIARRRRLAHVLHGVAVVLVVLIGLLPGGAWVVLPLESRFPAHLALPNEIAGIVALGGTERVAASSRRGQPLLDDPTPIAVLIELGRQYPDAKLVFTGGSSTLEEKPLTESDIVRAFVAELGIPGDRIIYEARSHNTRENAVFTLDLVRPKPGEKWVLVGQAISLPRALGSFRAVGWDTIPYPAGYYTPGASQQIWAATWPLA